MPKLERHIEAFRNLQESGEVPGDVAAAPDSLLRKTFSEDADAHAESLAKWDQSYDQLSAGRFRGILREIWLGEMQLFRETTNQAVFQRGHAWSGAGTFGIPLEMSSEGFFCDQLLGADGILAFGPENEFDLRTPRSFDIVGITVGGDCYSSIIGSAPGAQADGDPLRPRVLRCGPHLNLLRILLTDIFDALDADPARLQGPQIQKVLRSAIIGHLQAALQTDSAVPLPSYAARKKIVERARAHVLLNLHDPVTIGELCERIGVSRRTLQYSFQDIIGTNPVDFLRAMRLNSVRRELRAGNPGLVQIADVAARWGFWHLSHFSSDYRALFGELPSETLRRAR